MFITEFTRLVDLNIPHLRMIIEEKFNIPCWQQGLSPYPAPDTVRDLASATDTSINEILKKIQTIKKLTHNIEIASRELGDINHISQNYFLLDIRPDWSLTSQFIRGSRFLSSENPTSLIAEVKRADKVLLVCESGFRSFSGALYLRELGQGKTYSLKGGLKALYLSRA